MSKSSQLRWHHLSWDVDIILVYMLIYHLLMSSQMKCSYHLSWDVYVISRSGLDIIIVCILQFRKKINLIYSDSKRNGFFCVRETPDYADFILFSSLWFFYSPSFRLRDLVIFIISSLFGKKKMRSKSGSMNPVYWSLNWRER